MVCKVFQGEALQDEFSDKLFVPFPLSRRGLRGSNGRRSDRSVALRGHGHPEHLTFVLPEASLPFQTRENRYTILLHNNIKLYINLAKGTISCMQISFK